MNNFYNLENFEPNIIDIIHSYIESMINYEKKFFNDLPEYINNIYLNLYYNCDLTLLFGDNDLSIKEKIDILNKNNLEIYDIQNSIALVVKYNEEKKKYKYKWTMFKSNLFESDLNTNLIRQFKSLILKTKKLNKEYTEFTLDEIIDLSSFELCLHCVCKDYIKYTNEDNEFINLLSKKLN